MKYTIAQFAKEIRDLYPGDYDDLSDNRLVELWLNKYPEDQNKVNQNTQNIIPNKKGKSTNTIWILGVIISIILISTNPSYNDHLEEAKAVFKTALNSMSKEETDGVYGQIINEIANLAISSLIDSNASEYITRNNYYLFSTTVLTINSRREVIGLGILGKVYISDEVKNALKSIK